MKPQLETVRRTVTPTGPISCVYWKPKKAVSLLLGLNRFELLIDWAGSTSSPSRCSK
jgi:hypothetical protein